MQRARMASMSSWCVRPRVARDGRGSVGGTRVTMSHSCNVQSLLPLHTGGGQLARSAPRRAACSSHAPWLDLGAAPQLRVCNVVNRDVTSVKRVRAGARAAWVRSAKARRCGGSNARGPRVPSSTKGRMTGLGVLLSSGRSRACRVPRGGRRGTRPAAA